MTDFEIIALTVARVREEVEAKVCPIIDEGSVWGRATMKAAKDVREAREMQHKMSPDKTLPCTECTECTTNDNDKHSTTCSKYYF